jgi:hypothetical protein
MLVLSHAVILFFRFFILLKISYVYKKRISMKKILPIITFLFIVCLPLVHSQQVSDTSIYLLTCGPGTDTYSIYGHSAVRIVIPGKSSDKVYNWGVFDFDTPNFAWKFAKGRLDYMVIEQSLQSFVSEYIYEKRYVQSQKMNLSAVETEKLVSLINENLKPENAKYKYDFFYDNCSTRIRDIFEKSVGDKLLYPPVETGDIPTFRKMVAKYQVPVPWLQFGIDLIMGSTSDKKATFRDRMFLPIEMQKELSEAVVNRNGKMIPLLQNPEMILNFPVPVLHPKFLTSPVSIFTVISILIIVLSGLIKDKTIINLMDILVFSVFSILAILMVFFNYFTDHQQMIWNLNIIWLNPFILFCLGSILLKKTGLIWFRIVFYISTSFLVLHYFLPQEFNIAIMPLVIMIIIRSLFRGQFKWNPFAPLTKL